jgi:hypothetical protein
VARTFVWLAGEHFYIVGKLGYELSSFPPDAVSAGPVWRSVTVN